MRFSWSKQYCASAHTAGPKSIAPMLPGKYKIPLAEHAYVVLFRLLDLSPADPSLSRELTLLVWPLQQG